MKTFRAPFCVRLRDGRNCSIQADFGEVGKKTLD
jgi:hypothetical protein